MPEIPGPPDDYDERERRAWLEGAAMVADLQARQWRLIADRYRDELPDGDDNGAVEDDDGGGGAAGGDAPPETCPDCGTALLDAFGGATCPTCTEET